LVTDYGDGTCHVSQAAAPTANDDKVTTPVDTPVTIDVLANDIYCGTVEPATVVFPDSGSLGPWDGGTITYYAVAGSSCTDSFTYQICDTAGQCDSATVYITVGPQLPDLQHRIQTT
jgi:hypothetical protein